MSGDKNKTHPIVFISYSHDSAEHKDKVLAFANRLREDGIDAVLDQYEEAPAEGWPKWMDRQIEECDFVIVICTETYNKRASGKEEIGKGHGVRWESTLIYQDFYDAGSEITRFIPVLFKNGGPKNIPKPLRGQTQYRVEEAGVYESIYRRLTGQPETKKRKLGKIKPLPARSPKTDFFEDSVESIEGSSTEEKEGLGFSIGKQEVGRDSYQAGRDIIVQQAAEKKEEAGEEQKEEKEYGKKKVKKRKTSPKAIDTVPLPEKPKRKKKRTKSKKKTKKRKTSPGAVGTWPTPDKPKRKKKRTKVKKKVKKKKKSEKPSPVTFRAHWHHYTMPKLWTDLLIYLYSGLGEEKADDDLAERIKDLEKLDFDTAGRVPLKQGTKILIKPEMQGFRFSPEECVVKWYKDWLPVSFRMINEFEGALPKNGKKVDGQVSFFVGPLLIAEINLNVILKKHLSGDEEFKERKRTTWPYQKIFASYAHEDSDIVEIIEEAYSSFGNEYMRDFVTLRSGEEWKPALLELIKQADVFHLFWSNASKESYYVRKEWREALKRRKKSFIRPAYWETPMPGPLPSELQKIHFKQIKKFIELIKQP